MTLKKKFWREFPGGPVIGALASSARGHSSIPGWGTRHGQKERKKSGEIQAYREV